MSHHLSRSFLLLGIVALIFPAFTRAEDLPAASPDKQAYRQAIQKALAKQVDWDFTDTPLTEVVEKVRNDLEIKVLVDQKSLADLGVAPDTPVTLKISGVSAKSALSLLLRDLGLTTLMQYEVLLITSFDMADANLFAIPYDVTDLVLGEDGSEGADFDSLIDLIAHTIKPTTWDEVGGPGSIQSYQSVGILTLVVAQTDEVHEEVTQLLADLRAMRHPPQKPQKTASPIQGTPLEKTAPAAQTVAETAAQAAEKKILAALKKKVNWDFNEKPLTEVVEQLQKDLNIKGMLDHKSLNDWGIKVETPITLKVSGVSAFSALELMFQDLWLTFTIRDEVLLITSTDFAEIHLLTRNYDVSDMPAFRTEDGQVIPDYDEMIDLITKTIKPTTWDEVGGPGSIKSVDAPGIQALAVSQTLQIHEEIGQLLGNLRKHRKTPLTNEALEKLPPPPEPQSSTPFGMGMPGKIVSPIENLPPLEPDTKRDAVVQANNQFAFDLYRQLREKDRNLFFSPYSIATVLAMAHSGARGETAEEMAKMLHFTLPQEEIPAGYQSLLKATLPADRPGCEMNVANRLWCQQDYKFRESFLDINCNQFSSEVGLVDFRKFEAVRQQMNAWAERKTKQRITEAIPPGAIHEMTRLAIINAIYFKGKWETQFPKQNTKDQFFYADDKTVKVPMMSLLDSRHRYAEIDEGQILEKTYLGGDISMLILLPRKQSDLLDYMEAMLSHEKLNEWTEALGKRTVDVYLPRFKMETSYMLPSALNKLGMRKAFSLKDADFSGIKEESEPLAIDALIHKTFLQVDEEGTEAAAVTMMGCFGGMPPALKRPIFRADHPFLFLLRDTRTGCILFIGRVMQPPRETQ